MRSALEPEPTAFDLRVLRAVPSIADRPLLEARGLHVWGIAEALGELDVPMVDRVLGGLLHLGYVDAAGWNSQRHRRVWWRTERGDEAVRGSGS